MHSVLDFLFQATLLSTGVAMVQNLTEHVSDCLARAARIEERAATTEDPDIRHIYEEVARRWRGLAASYQLSESLARSIHDAEHAHRI